MFETFAAVLPLAIASAASPVILGVSITLLSKKNFGAAAAFLAGGVLVAAILALAGVSIAAGDDKVAESVGLPATSIDLAIGLLLLVFGIKVLFEKPKKRDEIPQAGSAHRGNLKWLAIGFIGNITNFDAVLLNLAAVREIFNSALSTMPKLELLSFCDFFFLAPALVPIAFYTFAPEASQKFLVPVGSAMKKYGQYVVGAIFIIFGAVLIMKGL